MLTMTALLFNGCAHHRSVELDRQLQAVDNTYIYDIKLKNIIEPLNREDEPLTGFPFISTSTQRDHKGHFSPDFYAKNKSTLRTSSLEDVDIWSLGLEPGLLDVIYTKATWIEDYKDVSDDLFINICYSNNLSDRQQEILKQWIRQGGIFWVENGVYTTGSEINITTTRDPKEQKFLGLDVSTMHFTLPEGLNKRDIVFDGLQTTLPFISIRSLQLDLKKAGEAFFIIEGESQIRDKKGQPLLSISKYGKGKIISLLPFESYDAYRDGELLRWQLLKQIETTSPKKEI